MGKRLDLEIRSVCHMTAATRGSRRVKLTNAQPGPPPPPKSKIKLYIRPRSSSETEKIRSIVQSGMPRYWGFLIENANAGLSTYLVLFDIAFIVLSF